MDAGKIVFNNFIAPLKAPGSLPGSVEVRESSALPSPSADEVAITFEQKKAGDSKKSSSTHAFDRGASPSKPAVIEKQQAPVPVAYGGNAPVVLFQEESLPMVSFGLTEGPKAKESHSHHPPAKIRRDRTDALLKRIAREKEQYGLRMQPPCNETSRMSLKDHVGATLSLTLPDDYASFLEKTNGLDHDGLVFYGSHPAPLEGYSDRLIDGIVEINKSRSDIAGLKNYLIVGESEDYLYAYRQDSQCYVALDSSSTKECRSYSSFRDMLSGALNEMA
jgi:hypothetical protein